MSRYVLQVICVPSRRPYLSRLRRGLIVHVVVLGQLALPDIPVLPLFSDIPYIITVTTTGAPISSEKASADKGTTFPPLPRDPHDLEFELQQRLQLRADIFRGKEGKASSTVATILGGKKEKRYQVAVGIELPEREWVPANAPLVGDGKEKVDSASGGKGSWVQRASFQSTFRLNCPPTFAVKNIDCNVCRACLPLARWCGSLI